MYRHLADMAVVQNRAGTFCCPPFRCASEGNAWTHFCEVKWVKGVSPMHLQRDVCSVYQADRVVAHW